LLHPKLRPIVPELITRCKAAGIDIIITQTLRTKDEQNALYAQGRTSPGSIVTNAKYPWSLHCWGVSVDFVPVVGGHAVWNNIGLFERVGRIGEILGLEWGGRWTSIVDRPHFQLKGYKWLDLQNRWGTPDKFIASWVPEPEQPKQEDKVDKINVIANGKHSLGYLIGGTSYVPVRVVSEALGASVTWDGATKTVTVKGGK